MPLPSLPLGLTYSGAALLLLAVVKWFWDLGKSITDIKDNHLTHIQKNGEDQVKEMQELRADFRTYFQPKS